MPLPEMPQTPPEELVGDLERRLSAKIQNRQLYARHAREHEKGGTDPMKTPVHDHTGTGAGGNVSLIIDDDADTYVDVEKTADSDVIESASGGTIRSRLSALGLQLANGTDLELYSDAFSTKVAHWDAATGHLAIDADGSAAAGATTMLSLTSTFTDPASGVAGVSSGPSLVMTAGNAQTFRSFQTAMTVSGAFTASGIISNLRGQITAVTSGQTLNDVRGADLFAIVNGGATIVDRYGVRINNATGAGSLTNQYGVYIENMAKGGTINRAIQSLGGLTTHLGAARFGSNTAPTNTTDGYVTAARLFLPDGALTDTDNVLQTTGPVAITNEGILRFYESGSTNYVGLKAPTTVQSEQYIYALPDDDPSDGQVLAVKSTAGSPTITTEWITGAGGVTDAADLTYTPADNEDYGGSDPGDTADALDVLAARTAIGREFIRAEQFVPRVTSPAPPAQRIDAGSNDITYRGIPFDKDSDEYVSYGFALPANYAASGNTPWGSTAGALNARFYWTALAGSATETVQFTIRMLSLRNDDAINAAMGTGVAASDALIATGDMHISSYTGEITPAGTLAAGNMLFIEVFRDVSEDSLAADAYLIGVEILWPVTSGGYA